MRDFMTGLSVGLLLGVSAPVTAATLIGSTGYLFGWTVTKNGEEVCYMPYIWTATKEIDCD